MFFPLFFSPVHTTSCLFCPQQASPVTGNCRLPFLIQLHTCHVALSVGTLLLQGAWDTRVIYSPSGDKSSETRVSFQMFYMKSPLFPIQLNGWAVCSTSSTKATSKTTKSLLFFFNTRRMSEIAVKNNFLVSRLLYNHVRFDEGRAELLSLGWWAATWGAGSRSFCSPVIALQQHPHQL